MTPEILHRAVAPHAPAGTDPIEELQRRWTLQILLCVNANACRFVDLKAAIPQVSATVLTQRLRALENAGLVERRYLPPPVARHVYVLAPGTAGLKPALDALAGWRAETADKRAVPASPEKAQSR
jgi:DNA-binding HxlR family transcriptional regulator